MRDRRAHAQQALRLLHLLARIGDRVAVVFQHAAGALMKALPFFGEAQAGGGAAQQANAQRTLQARDQLADGGLRGVERAGGARQAAEFDAEHEGRERAQGVHGVFDSGMDWMPFCHLPIRSCMKESRVLLHFQGHE
jgi:hypothetical protein